MSTELEHRDLGAGRPLVMLTGYGASLGHWPTALIAPLAARRRVVLVQNPGIGESAGPAEGCDATAARVVALLDTLGIDEADVVGWSMGGMTAQALAVLAPGRVGHLVLAAAAPGTGTAVAPDPGALKALSSGSPAAMLDVLFPGDPAAADAYRADIAAHPDLATAPPAVVAAQGAATRRWRDGADPTGPGTVHITAPTLVLQGERDALCPPANADRLAAVLPKATVDLVPGAGHGVLFSDPVARAERVLAACAG